MQTVKKHSDQNNKDTSKTINRWTVSRQLWLAYLSQQHIWCYVTTLLLIA